MLINIIGLLAYIFYYYYYKQSINQSIYALFRKEHYREHQNILPAVNDQDWSVNLPSGSRQGRLLLEPFNINYTVLWKSFHNTK